MTVIYKIKEKIHWPNAQWMSNNKSFSSTRCTQCRMIFRTKKWNCFLSNWSRKKYNSCFICRYESSLLDWDMKAYKRMNNMIIKYWFEWFKHYKEYLISVHEDLEWRRKNEMIAKNVTIINPPICKRIFKKEVWLNQKSKRKSPLI